ncbi:MAG: hypothetical protein ABFQ95_02135 [Pseudomonadota bacterium]
MFNYYNSCRMILFVGLLGFVMSSAYASLNLGQVLQAYPEAGQFRPSKENSFHMGNEPQLVKIGEHFYRVRFFMFQVPESMQAMHNFSFGKWAQAQGLLTAKSQLETRRFGKFIYFKSSEELESKGIFYVLSLGPVGDAPLEITLADVLQKSPQIAAFTPSNYVFGSQDVRVRKIVDHNYELRYFVYWMDPKNPLNTSLSEHLFKEVSAKLATMQPRDVSRGYGVLQVFSQTDAMKKRGIYFTLVLRRIS